MKYIYLFILLVTAVACANTKHSSKELRTPATNEPTKSYDYIKMIKMSCDLLMSISKYSVLTDSEEDLKRIELMRSSFESNDCVNDTGRSFDETLNANQREAVKFKKMLEGANRPRGEMLIKNQ